MNTTIIIANCKLSNNVLHTVPVITLCFQIISTCACVCALTFSRLLTGVNMINVIASVGPYISIVSSL